jgi:hypothetical protein
MRIEVGGVYGGIVLVPLYKERRSLHGSELDRNRMGIENAESGICGIVG